MLFEEVSGNYCNTDIKMYFNLNVIFNNIHNGKRTSFRIFG